MEEFDKKHWSWRRGSNKGLTQLPQPVANRQSHTSFPWKGWPSVHSPGQNIRKQRATDTIRGKDHSTSRKQWDTTVNKYDCCCPSRFLAWCTCLLLSICPSVPLSTVCADHYESIRFGHFTVRLNALPCTLTSSIRWCMCTLLGSVTYCERREPSSVSSTCSIMYPLVSRLHTSLFSIRSDYILLALILLYNTSFEYPLRPG